MLLKGKRIFIVEDNLENRAIAQMLLEKNGAKTAIERWGTDVTERMQRFMPIDLIILDLMFPGNVTGYDIFEEIRHHAEYKDIPIIAVSAADASIAIPETQRRGFSGFISKPIDFTLFPKQIARVLDGEAIWYTSEQF